MRRTVLTVTCLLGAPFLLGACGLKGDLKTPPPLWGEDARTPAEIEANKPTPKPSDTTEP